ncbi:MAG: VWA domain-containing protein [bacterium]|nr:VWA domain-containing protein [bacterium]
MTTRLRFKSRPCFLIASTAILLAAPVRAQAPEPGVFGEVIDVRVVNLEVVVTEKGTRVTGLSPDEFLLTVDGEEVPIEYFTEVHGGTAVVRGDEAQGTVPALAPGRPVGTSYLLFIDDYFSIPPQRNQVLRRMIDQLPHLAPEDRLAVVAFNGKKLEMLSTWSQSVETLTRVLQGALDRPAFGLRVTAELRTYDELRRQNFLPSPDRVDNQLNIEEQQQADMLASRVDRVVLAAAAALRGFANPPGRKVLLLMSGGWPYNPALWVVADPERAVLSDIHYGERLYRPLVDTANRLSYTVYPIDVPGWRDSVAGAEFATFDEAAGERRLLFDRDHQARSSLGLLADETGGKALLGGARAHALAQVVEDTRSYYWIGFTPTWQGDDASHKVVIKTRRKGLKVRSRQGFSDLSRQTEVSMMVESSLLFGNPPSSSLLAAEVGPGKRAGWGKVWVQLKIHVPLSALTFLPHREGYTAEAELRVAVLDQAGNTAEIPIIPLSITLEELPEEGRLGSYETSLKIRKQPHDMVVSLYDNASGTILATKLTVDPSS